MKHIVSRDNAHFKALKRLCSSGRERRKADRIVLDGMHLIQSHAQLGVQPGEVVVSESGRLKDEIAGYLASAENGGCITLLSDPLFLELAQVETPSGIFAVVQHPRCVCGINQGDDAVLLDGVQDPGNVGSILRSAAAAGFRQILLSEDCAQAWSPKVLRAGMGAHFQLNLYENADLCAFLDGYRGQAVLTTLDEAADSLYELKLSNSIAWVFGSEGLGVRPMCWKAPGVVFEYQCRARASR